MPDTNGVWLEFSRRNYTEMTQLQEALHRRRHQGEIPDVVILLEHTPCITIGRSGGTHNLLANTEVLERNGITVHETSRGGDITYHGPGQLICYPILSLQGDQRDIRMYARKMEEVMIRTVHAFGIEAERNAHYPGVWVGDSKIGAMGIAVRKWTTMHGIALNVCPDLEHFSFIVPCGIASHGVTSMSRVLGRPIKVDDVRSEMRRHFSDIFQIAMRPVELEQLVEETSLAKA
ncbi:lipoyl(octanoyl) transferase LipB [Pseudodesulfovibrio sediminis]|uniref:Octanoyltransferase n=1 Tax=Pseudodesulfovibrio sediminis TaxID=2810563 RepID=A0ABN6ESW9_9BACT|nr:lipoyl(octanoyl) transferase LipB [Pseudodesulfovibrio sediminis]BCS87973.1 octanoyltransferase [Pseudodesulfovibrio sediminis]